MKNKLKSVYLSYPYTADPQRCTDMMVWFARHVARTTPHIVPVTPHVTFHQILPEGPQTYDAAMYGCFSLLEGCDELWVLHPQPSRGMKMEIELCLQANIPILYLQDIAGYGLSPKDPDPVAHLYFEEVVADKYRILRCPERSSQAHKKAVRSFLTIHGEFMRLVGGGMHPTCADLGEDVTRITAGAFTFLMDTRDWGSTFYAWRDQIIEDLLALNKSALNGPIYHIVAPRACLYDGSSEWFSCLEEQCTDPEGLVYRAVREHITRMLTSPNRNNPQ